MTRLHPRHLLKQILLLAVLATNGHQAWTQVGGGSVVGVVQDPQEAAVPKARVLARNLGTNVANETVTNSAGYYEFPLLPAGTYRIEVEVSGFEPKRSADFILNTGTRPRIDLTLGVSAVAESVTVEATAPLVNSTTTDLGVVVEQRKIADLPLNGRNFQQLVALQPGVVNRPPSQTGGRGGIEFNGAPSFGNNLLLDGIDFSFGENNSAGNAGGLGGESVINSVSIEALQEFKSTGSAFSAEYGRATGGVLVLTTKSGGNQFHGALFEFLRNDKLDANTWDNNRRNTARTPLRWNQFGGNLGGPIRRDSLFFFFNYEGAQVRRATIQSGNVPTQALLDRVTPTIRGHLEGMADFCANAIPNQPFLCLHRRADTQSNKENTYLSRGDWNPSATQRISMRYNYVNQDFSRPGFATRPDNRQIFPVRTHNALVQHTWAITPTLVNELRAGFSRFDMDRANSSLFTEPATLNVPGQFTGDVQSRLWTLTNTYQLAGNLTWIRGTHTVKAGFDIRDMRSRRTQQTNPGHTYATIDDLIADRPLNIFVSPGNPGRGYRSWQTGFYLQDDWRVSRRLQINAGLRYEYYTPLKGAFNIATSDPFGPFQSNDEPLWEPDRNNFAPRLGFVFDVFGNQKLIVRSGGALTYSPQQPFFYYDFSFINPLIPFSTTLSPAVDIPAGVPTNYPFSQSFIARLAADPSLLPRGLVLGRNAVDGNRRDEYVGHYNFSLQYAITPIWTAQATYSGSRGVHLLNTRFPNLIQPSTGQRVVRSISDINYVEASGRHSYNSMQLSTNYRGRRGATLDLFYTLSKNLSYGASDSSEGPRQGDIQDFDNMAGSYGPKVGDGRHRVVAVAAYEVPTAPFAANSRIGRAFLGGWSLQGIHTWRSGQALNVLANLDLVRNTRTIGTRPDVVAGQDVYAKDRAVPQGAAYQFYTRYWVNPDAFDARAPYDQRRYGSVGYNTIYGPNSWNFDGSLIKRFPVAEGQRIEFRAEFFNAFNHANDNNPDLNSGGNLLAPANAALRVSPTFGLIGGRNGNREIQLGLKYQF